MGRHHRARRLVFLCCAALLVLPAALAAQQLEAGDTLHIRLLERIRSHHHAQPPVQALVIAPLASRDARIAIPPGTVLSGHVAGSGMERFGGKRHWLEIRLDSAAIPLYDALNDTLRTALSLRVVAIDDARESVDSGGRIIGPAIPSVVHSKGDWAVVAFGILHPVSAIVLATALEGEMKERHRAVSLDAGTEMSVVLTQRTMIPRLSGWKPPPSIASGENPDSLARSVPLRATLRARNAPSDAINIAVIGTAEQLREACESAGFTRAAPMSLGSDFKTFVRAAKGEGYGAQPVSELVLDGRSPDEVYEKVADTFLKRHHFRVWRWPAGAADDDSTALWLVAATHDTGLTFSRQRDAFTHTIDHRVDLERDKIVSDLVATNRVASLSYVPRVPPASGALIKGAPPAIVTDWKLAVLVLK
jgi:LssY-like putative type I secretion system component LssY